MLGPLMGAWLLSRTVWIVAWHEVPGTGPTQRNRPVGYGLIRAGVRIDSMIGKYPSETKYILRGEALIKLVSAYGVETPGT
jgi:hypothetical protein